jgi:Rieske Fe-S protein
VHLTRRAVVAGACGTACVAALSACASYGVGVAAAPAVPAPVPADPSAAPGAPAPAAPAPLVGTSDVPVGGGVVLAEQDIVVTQPVAGEFRAFSATCTHQGCAVDEVAGGTINCPCHSSRFAVENGSVVDGPASTPLPERAIEVDGDAIVLV